MRVRGCLGHRQHRRDAGIRAVDERSPFIAGARGDDLGEPLAQHRPPGEVELRGEVLAFESAYPQPLGVELRLKAPDGKPLAVGRAVGVVERRTGVEQVDAGFLAPHADRRHGVEERHEQRSTIDHRGVHDLALTRALGVPERGEHSHQQEHRPAAVVAHEVEWRGRRLVATGDVREHAGDGDVVEVMAGGARPGSVLAPSRHAPVDERRPPCEAGLGREAESLHDTGSEAFDEHVRLGDEVEDEIASRVLAYVDDDSGAPAARDVAHRITQREPGPGRLDADALGAEVGEHHGREGRRADARHLDEAHAGERPAHLITTMTWVLKTASRPSGVHSSRVSVA